MRNRWFYYIIPLTAIALVAAWGILHNLTTRTIEPPYSQDELARLVVDAVRTGDAARFAGAMFNLADFEEYVAAARDSADSADVAELERFAETQRADWSLYEQQMLEQFDMLLERADKLGLRNPVYDGFAVDHRRLDSATGRIIFEQFDMYLIDGDKRYTLEADMLRQTADGWKLSGDRLNLYPAP